MTQPRQTGRIFVGREREMAALRAAMDAAMNGHGRVVILAGEPGIGKTRMAQELASYAESLGAQVWWGVVSRATRRSSLLAVGTADPFLYPTDRSRTSSQPDGPRGSRYLRDYSRGSRQTG